MRFSSAALALTLLSAVPFSIPAHAADPQAVLSAARQAVEKAASTSPHGFDATSTGGSRCFASQQ